MSMKPRSSFFSAALMHRLFQIHLHDIAILTLPAGNVFTPPDGSVLTAHDVSDSAGIVAAHAGVEHRIPEKRMQQRLRNGLRFIRFDVGGVPAATTWLVHGGSRYIDELNWLLPIGVDELWIRDVFVAPSWRGKRLFTGIAAALVGLDGGPPRRVWSDVDWVDSASMRAHTAAGFQGVARVRALDFRGRLRLRSALPPWPLPITEIDTVSRWIWLCGEKSRRHQELLA